MTISFFAPGDVPQPPDKVRIEHLQAAPYPDGWRMKIEVHVTPFQRRPNLEIILLRVDAKEQPVANLSIVETMHPRMEFTLHIRGVENPYGYYRLRAVLYYWEQIGADSPEPPPMQIKDQREVEVVVVPENDL
jgi:hypothetical protein